MEELLKIFSALNDETRVKILVFLSKNGECCVCELQKYLDLGQSRLSRHLKILKDAKFLKMKRHQKWVHYGLSDNLDSFQSEIIKEISKKLEVVSYEKSSVCLYS
jgi:ArsR family transcriptional regulator